MATWLYVMLSIVSQTLIDAYCLISHIASEKSCWEEWENGKLVDGYKFSV